MLTYPTRGRTGFTLLEILAVTVLLALLLGALIPAFDRIQHAGNLAHATSTIAWLLEEARTHAMANNSHVFVGFQETDPVPTATTGIQKAGVGQIRVVLFECPDGTSGYDFRHPTSSWPKAGTHLQVLGRPWQFDQVHIAVSLGEVPETGPMGWASGRQSVNQFYRLGHPSCRAVTDIEWPQGAPTHQFVKVIHFGPQGIARIQYASNANGTRRCIEIGLQACHGTAVPGVPSDPNVGTHSAIQIDCPTGAVHVFRP